MPNVQAGDLAVVVGSHPQQKWTLGQIAKIGHRCPFDCFPDTIMWCFEEPLLGTRGQRMGCCEDHYLRRIDPLVEDVEGKRTNQLEGQPA